MNFNDKTKRIICITLAAALIVPLALSAIFMFIGA